MVRQNYKYEKRQRDLAKKKKQEEKRQSKLEKKKPPAETDTGADSPPDAETVSPDPGSGDLQPPA